MYLSPIGRPGIYSICFSQLDGDKDSFPLAEVFSAFIAIRLLRDNEEVVIEDYLISLIGEIWFDLEDKSLLGIILLPLLIWFDLQDMGFSHCPCYWLLGRTNRASFLGWCQSPGRFTGLAFSLGFGGWVLGPISKPYQDLPSSPFEFLPPSLPLD